jgi:serine/threonine protein kinase
MQLGRYTLGRLIGQGGAGAVYESVHPLLNRPVAIKVMLANDAEARKEFLHEARIIAALSHPNIINILDVDEYQGQSFLVMELLTSSLAQWVDRGPTRFGDLAIVILPLLDALEYAHAQKLIHRDLKPANVLLRSDGAPVLADFSLAFPAHNTPVELIGTPEYMAPEQLRRETIDQRTDIYALGAMMFELLTAKTPFQGDTSAQIRGHLQEQPPDPTTIVPSIPADVGRFVLKMLSKAPADRPQDIAKVREELQRLANPQSARAPALHTVARPAAVAAAPAPIPPMPVITQPTAQQARTIGFATIALIVIGLGIWLFGSIGGGTASSTTITVVIPTVQISRTTIATQQVSNGGSSEIGEQPTTSAEAPTSIITPLPFRALAAPVMAESRPAKGTYAFSYAGVTSISRDQNQTLWVIGEIRNDGSQDRSNIRVRVNLLDANGRVLASEDTSADSRMLRPGEASPFSVIFSESNPPPDSYAQLEVEILSKVAETYELDTVRDALLVDTREVGSALYSIFPEARGVVTNVSDRPISYPRITITFYDSDGFVVGSTSTFADDADDLLQPGESAPFRAISFISTSDVIASYYIQAEGQLEE